MDTNYEHYWTLSSSLTMKIKTLPWQRTTFSYLTLTRIWWCYIMIGLTQSPTAPILLWPPLATFLFEIDCIAFYFWMCFQFGTYKTRRKYKHPAIYIVKKPFFLIIVCFSAWDLFSCIYLLLIRIYNVCFLLPLLCPKVENCYEIFNRSSMWLPLALCIASRSRYLLSIKLPVSSVCMEALSLTCYGSDPPDNVPLKQYYDFESFSFCPLIFIKY